MSRAMFESMEEAMRARIGANLRAKRKAKGLTLKKAAAVAEVHWRHWQKIEAGDVNVTLATLVRLSVAVGLDTEVDLLLRAPRLPIDRTPVSPVDRALTAIRSRP